MFEEGDTIFGTGFSGTVSISYLGGTGNDVVLTLVAAAGLTGDDNSDGKVDAANYVLWRKNDINGQQGYNDWRANFGMTAPGSGSALAGDASLAAVPEPATMVFLMIGLTGLMLATCRRSLPVDFASICSEAQGPILARPRGRGSAFACPDQ